MDTPLEQFKQWLWPAYAVRVADPLISPWQMTGAEKAELEKQEAGLRANVAKITNLAEFAKATRILTESEAKRRESIETKAGGIVQAAGIVTALFSAVPAVSGRVWAATGWEKAVLLVLFGTSLVHLVMAIAMAVAARRSGAVYVPSADEAAEWAKDHKEDFQIEAAYLEIVRAKRNEGLVGMKANRLAAAETYYIRGLGAFALTFLFGLWIS
jgi:hypothetical protein